MNGLAKKSKQQEKWIKVESDRSKTSEFISSIRPNIESTRTKRVNKSEVYKRASAVCNNFGISGSYIGLPAAYGDEIYTEFDSAICGVFLGCERNKTFAAQLKEFYSKISELRDRKFEIFEGDIFDCLSQTNKKFSIIDLDLMNFLSTSKKTEVDTVTPIVNALEKSTTQKFVLLLWSLYGRNGPTEEKYDTEIRDYFLREIKKKYKVLQYLPFKYRDNVIPIKVEVLCLTHRKRRKK